MGKDKLKRWKENQTFPNVHQPTIKDIIDGKTYLKGEWNSKVFKNSNPIILELGCGKGEYSVGLAKRFPNHNHIGVDVKGHRFWRGAKTSLEENLDNVAFIRTKVEFIDRFFDEGEIAEIWLTFSDPQPKDEKGTKRITGPIFIEKYRKFLKPGGLIHVKTDNSALYEWTLAEYVKKEYAILEHTSDLYGKFLDDKDELTSEVLRIQTHYERIFIESTKTINYIKAKL